MDDETRPPDEHVGAPGPWGPPAYPPPVPGPLPVGVPFPPASPDPSGLSPWIHIWTRPRAVVRSILDTDPLRGSWKIPVLTGVCEGLLLAFVGAGAAEEQYGVDHAIALPFCLAAGLVFGPLILLLMVNVNAFLVQFTGEWLGGKGDFTAVRTALAWSLVPGLWALLLWAPRLALLGGQAFSTEMPADLDPASGAFLAVLEMIQAALAVWILAIQCKAIGEAHRITAWRGFLAQLLAFLLLGTVAAIIVLAIVAIALK